VTRNRKAQSQFPTAFFKDLQIRHHGFGGSHHFPQTYFSFVVQYIESPSVLRRDVVEDVGIPRDVRRLEGPSLGGERVNTELSSERANANKLWHRDGARREFTEAVGHLIVGEASSGEVVERTIRCDHDHNEENGHTPFVDDVMDSEALRSFDTLVLESYLVGGKSSNRRVLKGPDQSLSSEVKRSTGENCSRTASDQGMADLISGGIPGARLHWGGSTMPLKLRLNGHGASSAGDCGTTLSHFGDDQIDH
jgi:hypothetical protein